jgi:hypothetical protein
MIDEKDEAREHVEALFYLIESRKRRIELDLQYLNKN